MDGKEVFEKSLPEYLIEFFEALEEQIEKDNDRWGDTWKRRSIDGQEGRAFSRYKDYWDMFEGGGTPIPWLKVAGEAYICWLREKYCGQDEN